MINRKAVKGIPFVSLQSSLLLPETGVDFRFNLSGGDFFFCFPFL